MKPLGRRSLATFLRVALRIVQVALLIAAPIVAAGCAIALLKSYGVPLTWIDMPRPPSPVITWLFTFLIAVWLTSALIVVSRLRAIFATVAAGDPFVPENAGHLQVIWITLAVSELIRYALLAAIMAAAALLGIEGPAEMRNEPVNLPFGIWFAVLTVIVLSEVFREGSRLRQEQQLTV